MKLFHVLSGIGLLGLAGYSWFLPFIRDEFSRDRFKITAMFCALALGFVLFTGFLQLGSRHSVPVYVIYKLAATALGGGITLIGLALRMKELVNTAVFLGLTGSGFVCFGFSLYWGLAL